MVRIPFQDKILGVSCPAYCRRLLASHYYAQEAYSLPQAGFLGMSASGALGGNGRNKKPLWFNGTANEWKKWDFSVRKARLQ